MNQVAFHKRYKFLSKIHTFLFSGGYKSLESPMLANNFKMDSKTLQKSMGRLKTANKFRMETEFDDSTLDNNFDINEEKENYSDKDSKINSDNSKSESDSNKSVAGPLLTVEKILRSRNRIGQKGMKEYLLKWKGFSVEEATWESEETMDCEEMISEFEGTIDDHSVIIVKKDDEKNSDEDSEMNSENSESKSDSDGPLLIVEKILKSRNRKGCKEAKEYLLKWKGFGVEESTWETEDNMDCKEMICEFEFEKKQNKLLKARKDLKLPTNDYERKRMQNIIEMAEYKDNLKNSAKALKQTLKRKNKDKPFLKCLLCSKNYTQSAALERHKRVVHNIKPQKIESELYFECTIQTGLGQGTLGIEKICLETFKTYDMIKEHIARNHNITCSACNESFKTKHEEKRHNCFPFLKKWVELEANEICAICDNEFADEKELKGHVNKIHRLSTGQKKPSRSAPKLKYVESDSESDEESDEEVGPVSKKKPVAKKSLLKKPAAKKSKYVESDSESDKESFVESEEEEQEYVPKKGKRGPPAARSAIPTKRVAKKPQSGNSDKSVAGPLLTVEKILRSRNRIGQKGMKEYLLKWKGFSVEEATWESEETMDCEEMISEFEGAIDDN